MNRIVIFSAFYDPFISGAERMVKEVIERLQDRHTFIVVTARLDRRLTTYERRQNIEIKRIGFGFKFDKYLYPLLAPIYALKYQPKIVHAVMESYAGIALLFYSHINKFLKTIIYNSSFLILTLQSGDLDLPEKQARVPQWLWKRIHRAPDLVVSIGNSMAERARHLGAKNVQVIPNGVDLNFVRSNLDALRTQPFFRKGMGKEGGSTSTIQHRLICVARLSPEKGLEYLIDAMPAITREFPDAQLVLVGDGILKDQLKAVSYKLQARVEFLGNLPHEKTLEEIAKSEVLVLPSLAEGMGIVLVEAQALGVPVIGTNVGGIPDVIEHNKTGLLVSPRDPDAIARAVTLLLRDHELRERMVEEAKTRLAKFDWQNIAEQYSEIYSKAVNR